MNSKLLDYLVKFDYCLSILLYITSWWVEQNKVNLKKGYVVSNSLQKNYKQKYQSDKLYWAQARSYGPQHYMRSL